MVFLKIREQTRFFITHQKICQDNDVAFVGGRNYSIGSRMEGGKSCLVVASNYCFCYELPVETLCSITLAFRQNLNV